MLVKTMILIKRGSAAIFRLLAMVVTCAACLAVPTPVSVIRAAEAGR
jgi:hypothetical protein